MWIRDRKNQIRYTTQYSWNHRCGRRRLHNCFGFMVFLQMCIRDRLNGVHPWSIDHPTRYTLTVQLIRPGSAGLPDRVLDEKTIRFGFRTVQ